ncbi:DUF4251 domain-containing protein [Flavobacterium sp. TSSA_36]|jgi:hypothetical protein|uniref:DUF4251 domain-containing protein n=1 Tax=Flavobacterium sp. TSSA_36 TaxID=3447669 RepID=UPI003F378B2C
MNLLLKKTSVLLLFMVSSLLFSQEKSKKEIKRDQALAQQKKIEELIASKQFQFEANRALPMGYRSIDLTTNPNYISFSPDLIKSEMPFFGRATGSVPYGGGEGGLQFEGVPEVFTIEKTKKGHELKASVKGKNDHFKIQLTIFNDGGGSLMITSNNRASISYTGSISAIKK